MVVRKKKVAQLEEELAHAKAREGAVLADLADLRKELAELKVSYATQQLELRKTRESECKLRQDLQEAEQTRLALERGLIASNLQAERLLEAEVDEALEAELLESSPYKAHSPFGGAPMPHVRSARRGSATSVGSMCSAITIATNSTTRSRRSSLSSVGSAATSVGERKFSVVDLLSRLEERIDELENHGRQRGVQIHAPSSSDGSFPTPRQRHASTIHGVRKTKQRVVPKPKRPEGKRGVKKVRDSIFVNRKNIDRRDISKKRPLPRRKKPAPTKPSQVFINEAALSTTEAVSGTDLERDVQKQRENDDNEEDEEEDITAAIRQLTKSKSKELMDLEDPDKDEYSENMYANDHANDHDADAESSENESSSRPKSRVSRYSDEEEEEEEEDPRDKNRNTIAKGDQEEGDLVMKSQQEEEATSVAGKLELPDSEQEQSDLPPTETDENDDAQQVCESENTPPPSLVKRDSIHIHRVNSKRSHSSLSSGDNKSVGNGSREFSLRLLHGQSSEKLLSDAIAEL